ncbi:MAG TPA: DUF374 domain-containing protein [Acidobacteriota bacterium]|nr:DUF374 domain-containing protein [Acidobacteriota bacterium]HQG92308.1 DUF374 domain-containing protein [Acidobacteriota bacterium]
MTTGRPRPDAPPPETRRTETLGDRLFRRVGAPLIAGYIRALAATQRLRIEGLDQFDAAKASGRPIVFAFWHEDLFNVEIVNLRRGPKGRVAVMISRSRNGEMLTRVMERLGLVAVRGSSSRGAVGGLVELKHWLAIPSDPHPHCAALALDGPRGPRRVGKPGAALLARRARAMVVVLGFDPRPRITFNSWDRTRLPWPFSRFIVRAALLDTRDWGEDDTANLALMTAHLEPAEPAGGPRHDRAS